MWCNRHNYSHKSSTEEYSVVVVKFTAHACSVDSELLFSVALVGTCMPYRWYSSTQFMEGL